VCEAVGVTQPVLYRLFGDKRGLLDALADRGLQRYVARKAELEASDDPVRDLRAGWDDHMAFAAEHPALYQLMFTPRPWTGARARTGLMELLSATLTRCAAAGALRSTVEEAAALLLSANVGLALNRVAQPDLFGAPAISDALRDAVFGRILVAPEATPDADPLAGAARRLSAQLAVTHPEALVDEETALLHVWLDRLA
jgi:AcrR family transcriptional regulator